MEARRMGSQRADLRTYAYGVGRCKRIRSVAYRAFAANQRIVYERSPCDRRHYGRIDRAADTRFTTQSSYNKIRWLEVRCPGHRFQMSEA